MTAEEKLLEYGCEGVKILQNYSYDDALVGVTIDRRAVYDFDLMVKWLVEKENMEEIDAIEWVHYNTARALPYMGEDAPIIMFSEFQREER